MKKTLAVAGPLKTLFPCGAWKSSDPAGRWLLDFNENGCSWKENGAAGGVLKRDVPLSRSPWRIERQNDAEVLRFLGARESLIAEISNAGPRPSYMTLDLSGAALVATWHGLRWTVDAAGHLKALEQPGSSPATIKKFDFTRQAGDAHYFSVAEGQLTFGAEGAEDGPFHSRHLHRPPGASGVTLGRGYDMKERDRAKVISDLTSVGLDAQSAASFAEGARLEGGAAEAFVAANRERLGNLSPGQQKRLFAISYAQTKADVVRISNAQDVVAKYGAVNFSTLNPKIMDVLVDLRFRGDYTVESRKHVQPPAVQNDAAALRKVIEDTALWPNVPAERFKARVAFLQ